ncbi:mRNA cap guanine-N7 methyltransferase [Saxophila tyrrhenica]|uniref:mRNA cap guanine-N(7) methyltransferase n=1 Tax=Saxophila tyrrhenica TaxID=1690608 RepID=A0AAV9NVX8_9PEZI|nr:mRNA cap guanine-N7 methyltransferase [Saxophila tyrrhenica]
MAPPATTDPPPSNVSERRVPTKRKRETARPSNNSTRTSTPNAYSRRSPPRQAPPKRPADPEEDEGDRSPPRKQKRPGAGARINREALEAARLEREQERREAAERQQKVAASELVGDFYNSVPQRGREWRQTDSKIKGLRSLNNWIKSTLIQKFSRPETGVMNHFTVLDMACGKGGDLGKWEKAPTVPNLYVGCDIADISITQAKERWAESQQRSRGRHRRDAAMEAQFYVQDTFSKPLGEIPLIRQVGFNPNAGPGSGVIQPGMMMGGFDVVSMMFALHYSFETEELARGMLKNVAGALKKGGRFIGVMPNSDVISATVKKLLQAESKGKTANGKVSPGPAQKEKEGSEDGEVEDEEDDWDPEKPSEAANGATADGDDEDDWDPEKPSEPAPTANETNDEDEDWDPEKPSEPNPAIADVAGPSQPQTNGTTPAQQTPADPNLPPLEWGNSLYTVRFPRAQPLTKRPLPLDGIFRPPYGWKYHYQLEEAVDVPEFVVPWEGFRALAEDYGLELMYRKGFREVLDEIWDGSASGGLGDEAADGKLQRELGMLAERMGVLSRDRSQGKKGLLVGEEEMEAAGFYHAFCFYRT